MKLKGRELYRVMAQGVGFKGLGTGRSGFRVWGLGFRVRERKSGLRLTFLWRKSP